MRRAQGQGGEHRYLVAHRYVTAARPAVPPPVPDFSRSAALANPYADLGHGLGGPEGQHWYHGTATPYEGAPKSPRWDYEGHQAENWSTDLGTHYTALRDVAKQIATRKGMSPDSRVAHTRLHMDNPADYENEHELTDHAIGWARERGLHHGHHEDPNVDEIDEFGPEDASLHQKETWLGHHPQRHAISDGFLTHLKDQGHDGIVYGNSHEGPESHRSAIAFHDTPVTVDHWEHLDPRRVEHGRTAVLAPLYHGTSRDFDDVRPSREHGHEVFEGMSSPDHGYATSDPQQAKTYAEISGMMHGGRPRVYQVEHLGQPDELEHDPGYDADVRSRAGFHVVREVPGHELERMDRHGRTAGKGKPRHDAPDVARRADEAGEGRPQELAPGAEGDAVGEAALRAVAEHPRVASDLKRLPRPIQAAYHERVDDLRRGNTHSSTHALHGPLKGWNATNINFQNRIVHRNVGDELHVLSAGNHDLAYEQGVRRTARYTPPKERLFGRTYGLDTRIWDGDKLKDPVRTDIMATFDAFCTRHGYVGYETWAKIVFFGSEASTWTSKTLHGNNDFDLSIGIHYMLFRAHNTSFQSVTDEQIATGLTQQMHAELNNPVKIFPDVEGRWDETWFANLLGWDIRLIRPYAAWDVVTEEWIVRPPNLPEWSMQSFPEGPGAAEEIRGIIEMAEGILKMPEPHRTQNGAALWEFVHSNRSEAFGPNGEGWWDMRNAVEKGLDQKGLMQQLFLCHQRAVEHPESLAAPADWSNSPAVS